MLSYHCLSGRDFETLAAGLGSASTIAALRSAQISRRLVGLRAVLDRAEDAGYGEAPGFTSGFDLLIQVQGGNPVAVTDVLSYPFIGSWLASCLRLFEGPGDDIATGLGHMGNIAAAAAIRAGMPFRIELPVRDGAVSLPSLGRSLVPSCSSVAVHSDGHDTFIDDAPLAAGPCWQALRHWMTCEDEKPFAGALDDVDPYRGARGLPLAPRLNSPAADTWKSSLAAAWGILVRHHRDYADGIGAGMRALVPLVAAQPNRGINATSRESFGASAMSAPADPVTLACALIHEFQHAKLNAVLDLVSLYQPDETRYYAPWRQDPRPLGGLLHGAYAYLGVSDFWRIQRASAAMIHRDYAQMEFARWSDRTGQVVDVLLSSGKLTALGERFVYGMAERLRNWDERLPEEPSRLARIASGDHRLGWRLRNVRPDTDTVERLARAWSAGEAPPDRVGTAQLVDGGAALGASSRLDLIHMRLRDPNSVQNALLHHDWITATPADVSLANNDLHAAAMSYRGQIAADPHCHDAWIGLALTLRETGHVTAAIMNEPELVYAVYHQLLEETGHAPEPEILSGWLAPLVPADPWQ